MSKLILANDGIDAIGKSLLEKAGFTVITEKVAQENLATEINAKGYIALTVRSATKVRKDVIDACPNLKVIGRGGVGMDNIDVDYARSKGLQVINTPAASSNSASSSCWCRAASNSKAAATKFRCRSRGRRTSSPPPRHELCAMSFEP